MQRSFQRRKNTEQKFKWQPLRKWCRGNNAAPYEVDDPRFGTVKSWPGEAWLEVYGVDLIITIICNGSLTRLAAGFCIALHALSGNIR